MQLVCSGVPPVRTAARGTTPISKNTRLTLGFPDKQSNPLCRGRSSRNVPESNDPLSAVTVCGWGKGRTEVLLKKHY